jgi:hypothetical protein
MHELNAIRAYYAMSVNGLTPGQFKKGECPMMSARFAPVLFGLVLYCMMSLLVSGIATFRTAGLIEGFARLWIGAWLPSWLIAFPVVLAVAPVARRVVNGLVRS